MTNCYLTPFFLILLVLELWRTAPSCTCDSNQGRRPCRCRVGITGMEKNT